MLSLSTGPATEFLSLRSCMVVHALILLGCNKSLSMSSYQYPDMDIINV